MAKLEVKENVVFAEVKESVSPYGEMMKLLKEYIDQVDSITYCDALPDTGETDHLYIVRTGEAYIYDGEWIELTGGSDGITGISVNGTPQEVINHVVDLLIPEKTSELDNDSGYITDDALEGYAKETDIPTELSDLKNDMGYITEDALDGYALEDEIPTKVSELENDADYTTLEATKSEIAEQIAEIVAGAPESLDTLKEIADWIEHHEDDAAAMNTAIKEAQDTADSALTEAEAVKDSAITQVIVDGAYVDKRTDPAGDRYVDLGTMVNSVKVGTVTTGDSPSVTNSGTDKDVVMDFVFPSGGSPIISGTVPRGETLRFTTNSGLLYISNPYDETATPNNYGWTLLALMGGNGFLLAEEINTGGTMTAYVDLSGDVFALSSPGRDVDYILIGATLVD